MDDSYILKAYKWQIRSPCSQVGIQKVELALPLTCLNRCKVIEQLHPSLVTNTWDCL